MTTINISDLKPSAPSLCIPRVFPNIDEKRIRRVFDQLNLGQIERVDIVKKTTEKGENFNRVFIHFGRWASNENANKAREMLINGKEVKIIYDDPWFWKVSAYKQRQDTNSRPSVKKPQATASIVFEEAEEPAKVTPNPVTANPVTQKSPTNPQLPIPSRREKRNFKKPSGPIVGTLIIQEEVEEGEIAN
jgi:hypothetical protein